MFTSSFTASLLTASSLTATLAAPLTSAHTPCASSVAVNAVVTGTPFTMQPDMDLATDADKTSSSSQQVFHALPLSTSSSFPTSTHCAPPSPASTSTYLVRQHFTLAQRQAKDWAAVPSAPAIPPAAQTPAQDWDAASPAPTPTQNWDAAAPNAAPTPVQTWAAAPSAPILTPALTPTPSQEPYKPTPDHFGSRAMLAIFIGIGIVVLIVLIWSVIAWRHGQNPFACCGGFPGWPRKPASSGDRSQGSGDVEANGGGDGNGNGDLHRVGAGRHYARRPVSEAVELQPRQQWPQPAAFQQAKMGVAAQRDPMAPLPPRKPAPLVKSGGEAEWAREF
ncbi:hypothetical protein E8E13_011012 [Curvularia kusanoi]|uniref:Uncharacterized protein n=1 Tax=Curvularia kusanoi TaxID=90978 RepID=A0A9P4THW0_CURKU|nr:hypothetical protein E8E13_011012 [Curvularia kusanoi]